MKDAQKPDHISLSTLIGRLNDGWYQIPDFQRDFEWKPWDISELMRSIFLDYYIGSLLLWKGTKQNFETLSCEPVYGYSGDDRPEYIVLDGQQRLTAMYYAFLSPDQPLPNRRNRAIYYIDIHKYMNEEHDEAFQYDWASKRLLSLLDDRTAQFQQHIFPLSIVGEGGRKLYKWFQDYEDYWKDAAKSAEDAGEADDAKLAHKHATNASRFADDVSELIEQYQISYIELDKDLPVDKVCDIFTQINSRGIRLDIFDLMNAILKPKEIQLKHMWREAQERLSFADSEKMNVYILQVMSILRQNYCSPKYLYYLIPGQEKVIRDDTGKQKDVLVSDAEMFKELWDKAVSALQDTMKRLNQPQEYGVTSSQYLPYVSILPVFSAIRAHAKTLPAPRQLDAQRKIRHWYWASVFMNRYSGSVESTAARDFLDIKLWMENDDDKPPFIGEFDLRYKSSLDLHREVKRGTSVYNGIFNLLVIGGARDWVTGDIPHHDELDDHHIVPAWWGREHLDGNSFNSILNRTPLIADTNRRIIREKLPNQYLPELIKENGEERVRAILETHLISPKAQEILLRSPFEKEDFDEFVSERQKTIFGAIEDLLVKERLDLPADLRELDVKVEACERSLRRLIDQHLGGDNERLPQHVSVKVSERLQRASKKNAALDMDLYSTLKGQLEFFDLRELQDTITNKALWSSFETVFGNKETLAGKFGQLAELRNGIAHNRTVDDVTRKEGEAALIWFDQVLLKPVRT